MRVELVDIGGSKKCKTIEVENLVQVIEEIAKLLGVPPVDVSIDGWGRENNWRTYGVIYKNSICVGCISVC